MAKGTITLSGSTVGTKMESLEVEQGATGGVAGLFKVDNNDTDKVAMSIEASNIDADVLDVSMDAVTTAKGIDITADALTTGSALYVDSDASNTSTRSIAQIIQNNTSATGATALTLQADAGRGLFINTDLPAGGYSLEIDAEQTTANTAKIASVSTSGTTLEISAAGVLTGKVIDITADAATTGTGIFMSMDGLTSGKAINVTSTGTLTGNLIDLAADSATTGKGINMSMDGLTTGSALYIDSDSSSTGARNIVEIIQNNTSASSAVGLKVQQDSEAPTAVFEGSNIYVRKGSGFQTLTTSSWVMGG